jgi:hypothetical protein
MHVDTHLRRDPEEFEWQDLAICHDDEIVTRICSDLTQELLVSTYLHGLQDRDVMCECEFLHGARFHDLLSSEGFVRIGYSEGNIEPWVCEEICENCRSERWCTKKSDTRHDGGVTELRIRYKNSHERQDD